MDKPRSITIVTPVYNDWSSLRELIRAIDTAVPSYVSEISVLVVNDGSIDPSPAPEELLDGVRRIREVEIVSLVVNLGHQRAICIGLAETLKKGCPDLLVVMDSDGEDRPADIGPLINAYCDNRKNIIVARRAKRSEGLAFRFLYRCYKLVFRLLTGHFIDFGNFCVIPGALLPRIIFDANTWNNLAASIYKSKVPITRVATARGRRYFGESRMNLVSLLGHGLGALSVFVDIILIRVLVASVILVVLVVVGVAVVVSIRLVTDLAIPGWATNMTGFLLIILLQTVLFFSGAVLFTLSSRSTKQVTPASEGELMIGGRAVGKKQ